MNVVHITKIRMSHIKLSNDNFYRTNALFLLIENGIEIILRNVTVLQYIKCIKSIKITDTFF